MNFRFSGVKQTDSKQRSRHVVFPETGAEIPLARRIDDMTRGEDHIAVDIRIS